MNENPSKSTNKIGFILISIFLIILFALFVYLLVFRGSSTSTKPSSSKTAPITSSVTITATGFDPQEIEVSKGTTVIWTNTDTALHQVASDPYPLDNALKELGKARILSNNDTFSFTFDQSGTFTYHDDLNPMKFKGSVVVK